MNATLAPLVPFGLAVDFPPGTALSELDFNELREWLNRHRVVRLRGLAPVEPHVLAATSRRLGPLQPWSFGAVHELKQAAAPENYLYTPHDVPLHWDGAFADAVPHWLVFQCVAAPAPGSGGETVFVDTTVVLKSASPAQRTAWGRARVRYETERKAHYGGSFTSPVIRAHPTLGVEVIRFAEAVDDLNPVSVEPLGLAPSEGRALVEGLSRALAAPDAALILGWAAGDYVIADNHALLHGRRAFSDGAPRHLRRVNVLDEDLGWRAKLRAAWRVRRPEFLRAELPILLIPALLSAPEIAALASLRFLEGTTLFFLMFNIGDMINCWLDRDLDLHRKTHLAESVARLGRRSLAIQVGVSVAVALALAAHLAWTLSRPWLVPAGVTGTLLAAGYTAPPLRLKSRGVLQVLAYVGLLFVGPMVLISGLFTAWPSMMVILTSVAFGVMQASILLVNNAEDLDEDEREGIRTASVALGALGTISLARGMMLVGGLCLSALWAGGLASGWRLALLPLLACVAWNVRWLHALRHRLRSLEEPARRAAIRDQGKYVPRRIEAGAWAAALVAVGILLSRRWP